MKADDLRRIVEGATALPWRFNDLTGDIEAPKGGPNQFLSKPIAQLYIGNHRRNVDLILAMVNHAGPLAELLAACERFDETDGRNPAEILAALARVQTMMAGPAGAPESAPLEVVTSERDGARMVGDALAMVGDALAARIEDLGNERDRLHAALARLLWDSVADDAECTCSPGDVCPQCQATQALGLGRWRGARWAERLLPTRPASPADDVLAPVPPEVAAARAVTPAQVTEALQAGARERELGERRVARRRRRSRR